MKTGNRLFLSGLLGAAMTIAAIVGPTAALGADASADAVPCPGSSGPLVVNSYATYRNSLDVGDDGHFWALDEARLSFQIWQVGTDTYCVKQQHLGTFTTFAGVSPQGTGTVRGGVTGRWNGEIVAVVHGTFAPTVPTSGFVGDFDGQCQQDGTCPGTRVNVRVYFSSIASAQFFVLAAKYAAGTCGVWKQSLDGNTGDIVC